VPYHLYVVKIWQEGIMRHAGAVVAGAGRAAADTWRGIWRNRRPEQTPLLVLGAVLIASGLFHVGVWLADWGSLAGSVSWRKPITFGLSAGILALSLGWLTGWLRPTRASLPMAWVYTLAMGIEVLLITVQQWRGVPSHFNAATPLDAAIFQAMGLLILVASAQIAWWTWRAFRAIDAPRDMVHAIRVGLLFVNLSNLLGVAIIVNARLLGVAGVTEGLNVFGAAGAMKVPHGLALHAIQVLPALAWLLAALTRLGPHARLRLVQVATAGYGMLLLSAAVQTFSGRAPLDLTAGTLLLAVGGACLLVLPLIMAMRGIRREAAGLSAAHGPAVSPTAG
jgi:hypothetical protein